MTNTSTVRLIAFILTCWWPAIIEAQNDPMNELKIAHTDDFELDGKGSNPAWNQSEWTALSPLKDPGPVYETRTKVLYSDSGIYFLFWCEDKHITSTLKEDFADLYNEDVVEVFLWTDEEHPLYFEYELSPHNYELPIIIPNFGGKFMGWRPWHYEGDRRTRHATHIDYQGDEVVSWTAEFFIPYKLMNPLKNVPPSQGTIWRANMYRIDYDQEQTVWWAWQPIKRNFHDYQLFGKFLFK